MVEPNGQIKDIKPDFQAIAYYSVAIDPNKTLDDVDPIFSDVCKSWEFLSMSKDDVRISDISCRFSFVATTFKKDPRRKGYYASI
jgi:hypothetical protein